MNRIANLSIVAVVLTMTGCVGAQDDGGKWNWQKAQARQEAAQREAVQQQETIWAEKRAALMEKLTPEAKAVLSEDEIDAIMTCAVRGPTFRVDRFGTCLGAMNKVLHNSPDYLGARLALDAKCANLAAKYRNSNPEAGPIADVIVSELAPVVDDVLQRRAKVFQDNGWTDLGGPNLRRDWDAGLRQAAIAAIIAARTESDSKR